MKQCKKCKEFKSLADFWANRDSHDKLQYKCKVCMTIDYKDWVKNNDPKRQAYSARNKNKFRDNQLQRNFGISLIEYNQILNSQNGACAICKSSSSKNLAVDHCHDTNQIRSLLCLACNTALGVIEGSRVSLRTYLDYIEEHKLKSKKETKKRLKNEN